MDFVKSKRVWIAVGVIAALGVSAAWQTRIVALLALGTKVYDQMAKAA